MKNKHKEHGPDHARKPEEQADILCYNHESTLYNSITAMMMPVFTFEKSLLKWQDKYQTCHPLCDCRVKSRDIRHQMVDHFITSPQYLVKASINSFLRARLSTSLILLPHSCPESGLHAAD